MDSNMAIKLAKELQLRVGCLPSVEAYPFHLDSQPGCVVAQLMVQPRSWAEISRVIRAARTMKLSVRACGDQTGGNHSIYGGLGFNGPPGVLVDCSQLADSPRIELVEVRKKGELGEYPGLRVLAGVKITELIDFQTRQRIEVCQSVELANTQGTVVGAVTSGAVGLINADTNQVCCSGARGGCLADEVLSLRVVNCHGELIEYSSLEEVASGAASLGLLGVVYDVVLRYRNITISDVSYCFYKWSNILGFELSELVKAVHTNAVTQLIYLPFNSIPPPINSNNIANHDIKVELSLQEKLRAWVPSNDSVMLRTCCVNKAEMQQQQYHQQQQLSNGECPPSQFDSEPRQLVYLLDSIFGPTPVDLVKSPESTPELLSLAFENMHRRFKTQPHTRQYTPWAVNGLAAPVDCPTRSFSFTVQTTEQLKEFVETVQHLLEELQSLVRPFNENSELKDANFAINLGFRVHFTSGTSAGRLLGLGLKSEVGLGAVAHPPDKGVVLAHFHLLGLTMPGPCTAWNNAISAILRKLFTNHPTISPHWRTQWPDTELIVKRFREIVDTSLEKLKHYAKIADRDGVFLNSELEKIFYPKLEFYQELYRKQRAVVIPQFQ